MTRWTRVRQLFGRGLKADVEHELSFHLDMRVRELIAQGMTPEEARAVALRRFGDYDGSRRECLEIDERRRRRMTRTEYLQELKQDVGYAIRMLRRSPGFTIVALLTLALGIGANSAIFSVVHGVLLQSLPYRDGDRLYRVRMLYPDGTPYSSLSAPDFMSVRRDTRAFDQIEAYATSVFTMVGAGEPREVQGVAVSDGLFGLLGLPMETGRGFVREDHHPGRGNVVVLDHGFWLRHFGGITTMVGQTLSLGGRAYAVIGVLSPGARLPVAADLYAPLEYNASFDASTATQRRSEFLAVLGRARPGVDEKAVDADLHHIGTALQTMFPETNGRLTFNAVSLRDHIAGDARTPLYMLLGAVAFVLLVACANVANLLLARASSRQSELAVRSALGAGRGRVFRQLMTESVVLGVAGGVLGLAVAYLGTRALVAAQPADIPRLDEIGVDGRVVWFTLGLSLLTGLVFGILPALQMAGRTLTQVMREGGRGSGASTGHRLRAALVVVEMALAVVLLTGAGLLIHSFVQVTRVAPGFQIDKLMAFRLSLQGPSYERGEQIRTRVQEFEARLLALPGVTAAAATTVLPLSGGGAVLDFEVENAPPPPANVNREILVASVTSGYFDAIGAPIRRGRGLSASDTSEAPLVAVINDAAVRKWFPDRDPIGHYVVVGGQRRAIVGVVGDVLQRDLSQPAAPHLFAPYAQRTARTIRMVVRTAADPLAHAPAIREALRSIDPDLAIMAFTPFTELVDNSMARRRFYMTLLALFAGVALALASSGIFGVMSYAVAQRSREISIRMALGAHASDVLRMIMHRALVLAAIGVVVGLAAALSLARVIQGQLYGITSFDPVTMIGVTVALAASALAASFVPARRAAGLDPGDALRMG